MTPHHRPELILGFVLLSLVSLSVAMRQQRDADWPQLLQQPASVDPAYAALQQRANLSLERMVQLDPIWE